MISAGLAHPTNLGGWQLENILLKTLTVSREGACWRHHNREHTQMSSTRIRVLLVSMIAMLAIGAVAAGSAQAIRPTWDKGGAALAVGAKLPIKDSSWRSRLWFNAAGFVIQCEKDTSKGTIDNVENEAHEIEGVDTGSVTYEGCQVWTLHEIGAAGKKQWAPKKT